MVATMCLSFTACADTSYAMTADGNKIPAGLYILYQLNAVNQAKNNEDFDSSLEKVWDNKIEDKPMADWVNEKTVELVKGHQENENLFEELGLSFSAEEKTQISKTVEQNWPMYEETYKDYGIGKSSYQLMLTNQMKYSAIFDAYYGEGGSEEVTEDTLKSYYYDNFTQAQILAFSTIDSATSKIMEDADKEVMKNTADSYFERAQGGESMVDLINDYNAQQAVVAGKEPPTVDETQKFITTLKKDQTSYNVSETLNKAIFDAAFNTPIMVTEDNGYYIIYRHDIKENDSFTTLKSSLLQDMKQEDFDKMLAEKAEDIEIVENTAAIKKYKPTKLIKPTKATSSKAGS